MPLLLCADDLALISRPTRGAASLLHALHQLSIHRQHVSNKKTLVLQHCRLALSSLPILYHLSHSSKPQQKVNDFEYPGLILDTQCGLMEATARLYCNEYLLLSGWCSLTLESTFKVTGWRQPGVQPGAGPSLRAPEEGPPHCHLGWAAHLLLPRHAGRQQMRLPPLGPHSSQAADTHAESGVL